MGSLAAMRKFIVICALMVTFVGIGKAQEASSSKPESNEAIKKEILKLEDDQHVAFVNGDAGIIDRMYADDAALTYADGKLITKAQLLADIRSGKHKLYQVTHDNLKMEMYGNTVVVTGHSTATGTMYNTPRVLTNVYVKLNGQWKLVAHHVTYVAKE
jgi:ketosteroid isomerase-like protein